MTFFLYAMLAVVLLIHQALAFPSPVFQNLTRQVLNRRDIPPIPPRPDNVGLRTFHSNQFLFFEEIGFVDESPAVDAAPVFLFGRTSKHKVSVHMDCPLGDPNTAIRIHVTQRVPSSLDQILQGRILGQVDRKELTLAILERIVQTQGPTTVVSDLDQG